jgi:type IV pilus assembly protein PilB
VETAPAQFEDEWMVKILTSAGLAGAPEIDELRRSRRPSVAEGLVERGRVTREGLSRALLDGGGVPTAAPTARSLDKMALALMPEALCRKHRMLPFRLEGDSVHLLMDDPTDLVALDVATSVTGRRPVPFFGWRDKLDELISVGYGSETVVFDLLEKIPDRGRVECLDEESGSADPAQRQAIPAPVIRLVDSIIAQAVHLGASDIHVEHDALNTQVRFRVDGELRPMMTLPRYIGEGPMVSRIKIMANLDVADHRRPQDGRAKLKVSGNEVGLRVSTLPTSFGEKAVLRILDQRQAEMPLDSLGFRPAAYERLARLIASEQGMILMTGPTGSGKTTTLYSMLNRIKSTNINIVTVEDPVEYRLAGINQVQVNDKAGLGFATVLRSVLRQDPDVILVGEIRDRETATIAFQAAMTGHLVFSTVHTNDALSTIHRLMDMGVERYKLAPALLAIVSQRLVRRVCPECREEHPVERRLAEEMARYNLPARYFRGRGCEACKFSGWKGRLAVAEVLDCSDVRMRELLDSGADEARLREESLKHGWLSTMAEDALWHLSQGNAGLEEVMAYLPGLAARVPDAPAAPPVAPPSAPAVGAKKILVVDDNADNRTLAVEGLRSDGYDLVEVENGREALRRIQQDPPDLVLLDLMMPVMNGFEVIKRVRGELGLVDLPIMVLTAMNESESQVLTLELGADDYVSKPFEPKVLRARVSALFRRRSGGGAPSPLDGKPAARGVPPLVGAPGAAS